MKNKQLLIVLGLLGLVGILIWRLADTKPLDQRLVGRWINTAEDQSIWFRDDGHGFLTAPKSPGSSVRFTWYTPEPHQIVMNMAGIKEEIRSQYTLEGEILQMEMGAFHRITTGPQP